MKVVLGCFRFAHQKQYPRDPITLSEDDRGVQSPPKRKVFRFHYPLPFSEGEPESLQIHSLKLT